MKDTATHKFSSTTALTIFLSISSAAVVVLTLLGYGVSLAAESSFGIPHAVIFNSTSDLLTLGGWAVIHMLSYLDRMQSWSFHAESWMKLWPAAKAALATSMAVFVLGGAMLAARWFIGRWSWLQRTKMQKLVSPHGRSAKIVAFPLIVLVGIFAGMPLAMLAILLGLALLGCVLSIVPIVGIHAGTGHIDDWVIGPSLCMPQRSREARLKEGQAGEPDTVEKPRVATCVAVKKADGKEFRGRVVFATFNAIVLYDPEAGSVQRVSTDGASIEVIDELLS